MIPRLVRRPVHVPWPKVFHFFFFPARERDNGPGSLMGFKRTKLLLLDQRYLPQVLRVRERGCLAGCRRAPSFSEACDWGISARVGNTTSRPYLIEGRGITRSASSGWRRPAQNAAWTRGQSGRGTTKGRASLAMRTRWTSWRCLVCGATTVDCNGGRRGRITFKYVTGKVTITRRVGRLLTGA